VVVNTLRPFTFFDADGGTSPDPDNGDEDE
jgi:hypothetical protein